MTALLCYEYDVCLFVYNRKWKWTHDRIGRCLGSLLAKADPDGSILWSRILLRKTSGGVEKCGVLHFVGNNVLHPTAHMSHYLSICWASCWYICLYVCGCRYLLVCCGVWTCRSEEAACGCRWPTTAMSPSHFPSGLRPCWSVLGWNGHMGLGFWVHTASHSVGICLARIVNAIWCAAVVCFCCSTLSTYVDDIFHLVTKHNLDAGG